MKHLRRSRAAAWALLVWVVLSAGLQAAAPTLSGFAYLHWLADDLPFAWPHRLPGWGWRSLILAVLVLIALRSWALRTHQGEVVVQAVHLRGESATDGSASGAALAAVIHEVLNRVGVTPHGVIPTYTGIDPRANEIGTVTHPPLAGLVARVGASFLRHTLRPAGWMLTVEERPSDVDSSVGMAFALEHIATGRMVLTDTVWADTHGAAVRRIAYEVAAWRFRQASPSSTRRRPTWYFSSNGLRCYDEALYYAKRRRFDETIRSANDGLREDPSNLALRRVLGETHERVGRYVDAISVYASGLVLLRDDLNGWRRTGPAEPTGPVSRRWPRPRRDPNGNNRWPRRPRRPVRSKDASGVLWRYMTVLNMVDKWVDRWVDDLLNEEDQHRRAIAGANQQSNNATPPRPPSSPLAPFHNRPSRCWLSGDRASWMDDEQDRVRRRRRDQAQRLRGFFSLRYRHVLAAEFPLLDACWFVERNKRRRSFADLIPPGTHDTAVDAARSSARHTSPSTGPLSDLITLTAEQITLDGPPRNWFRRHRRNIDQPAWVGVEPAIADLAGLFALLDRLQDQVDKPPAARAHGQRSTPGGGYNADDLAEVLRSAAEHLGLSPDHGHTFATVAQALTDQPTWARLGLDRLLIGQVASWTARQLLRIDRQGRPSPWRPAATTAAGLLSENEACLLTHVRANLDMRRFILRAGLDEVATLHQHSLADAPALGSAPMRRMLWLIGRFRLLNRTYYLQAPAIRAAHFNALAQAHNGDEGCWVLREVTARRAQQIASPWTARRWMLRTWRSRRSGEAVGQWNLFYYATCVLGAVVQDPDHKLQNKLDRRVENARRSNGHQRFGGQKLPRTWQERNDSFCWAAIRGLTHAILIHRRGEVSAFDAGALDWILHEDADLDKLRLHPRFLRWAAGTFSVDMMDAQKSTGYRAMTHWRVDYPEHRPDVGRSAATTTGRADQPPLRLTSGSYGRARWWTRDDRIWWLANDLYLVGGLKILAPRTALQWRELAHRGSRSTFERLLLSHQFAAMADDNETAWRLIAQYRTFAARPDLRLDVALKLRSMLPEPGPMPGFPRLNQVHEDARYLDYDTLDARLECLLTEALGNAARLRCLPQQPIDSPAARINALAAMTTAAEHWEELLRVVDQVLVAGEWTPTNHPPQP